jgi:hypothetical protein
MSTNKLVIVVYSSNPSYEEVKRVAVQGKSCAKMKNPTQK